MLLKYFFVGIKNCISHFASFIYELLKCVLFIAIPFFAGSTLMLLLSVLFIIGLFICGGWAINLIFDTNIQTPYHALLQLTGTALYGQVAVSLFCCVTSVFIFFIFAKRGRDIAQVNSPVGDKILEYLSDFIYAFLLFLVVTAFLMSISLVFGLPEVASLMGWDAEASYGIARAVFVPMLFFVGVATVIFDGNE